MIITNTIRPMNIGASTLISSTRIDTMINNTIIPMITTEILPNVKLLNAALLNKVFSHIVRPRKLDI